MTNKSFKNGHLYSPWFWVILSVSIILRLWIATYNTDSNDNHLEVIEKIMDGVFPVVGDCWQCYHVKAYHFVAAMLLDWVSINHPLNQIRFLQYGNVLLGIATILLLWAWLQPLTINHKWKLTLFALVALNPRLAAINSQLTNDSLIIFTATACFFSYARFLDTRRFGYLWIALIFSGLAAASKASGLVVVIVLFGHLLLLTVSRPKQVLQLKKQLVLSIVVSFLAFSWVPYSGYMQNAEKAGTPLANNIKKFPFPNWHTDKRWSAAGTTSIVNTYFTFRWLGLIKYPYINKGRSLYPEHRTNHWAQIYARNVFSRFDRWPEPWSTNGYWTTKVGQAAITLGIISLGVFLTGLALFAFDVINRSRSISSIRQLTVDSRVFLAGAGLAMIAMSLKLSLDFQTYAIMKAIYIYPGIIGILALLVYGISFITKKLKTSLQNGIQLGLICLILFHFLDLAILGTDLQAKYTQQLHEDETFEALSLKPNQVRLDEVHVNKITQRTGNVQINKSYSNLHLTGGYKKFRYGFGAHAISTMEFSLNRKYKFFETSMALADESYSSDGVRFEIWGDGRMLYRGPRMIDHQLESVRVNVSKVDDLTLKVQPLGSSYGDHANWLHPILTKKANR